MMSWNRPAIRRKGLRGLAWLVGIVAILCGIFSVWVWYLNRPPHYTFRVPPVPSPNAFDDFHRASDIIAGRKALGTVILDWKRHAIVRPQQPSSSMRKTPPPNTIVPRVALTAFLQHNTAALRLIRVGLTHQYAIPTVLNESYQQYSDRNYRYVEWHRNCRELLAIRALYCMNGNDPHMTAEALIDFMQYRLLTGRLLRENGMAELRPLATCLSVSEARAMSARLAGFARARRSYAKDTEQQRALYLNRLTVGFRGGYAPESVTDRWKLATTFIHPSPTEDRGVLPGLWFAYTIPNTRVLELADRYLTNCITAAKQPCSSHVSFPASPPDPFNYATFGWDEREKDRVAWALQTFNGDALLITFALEGYHKAHGAYPATLQPLIADGWLTALPVDAFTLKNTICYRRNGTGYRLYSRGPDGKDDGGKPLRTLGRIVGPDSSGDVIFGITNEAEPNSNFGRL